MRPWVHSAPGLQQTAPPEVSRISTAPRNEMYQCVPHCLRILIVAAVVQSRRRSRLTAMYSTNVGLASGLPHLRHVLQIQ